MTARDLAAALGGRWHGRYGTACCPGHPDKNPSLCISNGRDGHVLLKCFAGCDQAAVIDALHSRGLWTSSVDFSGNRIGGAAAQETQAARRRQEARRAAFIEQAWQEAWKVAVPATDSPIATAWLPARGIDPAALPLDRMPLRWHPRCPRGAETAPAMLALMTRPITAEPCGIHRTFLLADGSAKAFGPQSRTMLGHAGIVRLSPDDEVSGGLGIAEGIETALSVMAIGWRPIWAGGSLEAVRRFPVLAGIECLTIFADPKPHELAGARACRARWTEAGRETGIWIPGTGDWNDALRASA